MTDIVEEVSVGHSARKNMHQSPEQIAERKIYPGHELISASYRLLRDRLIVTGKISHYLR